MSNIIICSWNANGLRNRVGELIEFLNRENIDIMLLNETRYNNTIKLKIKNYKIVRADKSSAAGGIAILIKNEVPFKEVQIINNDSPIENLCIKLASNLHIICAYCSPNAEFTDKHIQTLMNVGNKVIVMGDLNAKHNAWNCQRNNKRGRVLYNYVQHKNCTVLFPNEPTHHPENGSTPTTIDITINKNCNQASNIQILNELSSDHVPITLTLTKQIKNTNKSIQYDYDKVDWDKFTKLTNEQININPTIENAENIDREVQRLTSKIQYCIEKLIPTKTSQQIQDRLPEHITKSIAERNRIRKLWQRTRIIEYKVQTIRKTMEIKAKIAKYRNDKWTRKLQKLNINDNSLWRMTKIFKKEYHPISTLVKNDTEALTDQEKAEMLASQFEEVHKIELENNTREQDLIITEVNNYIHNNNNTENWYQFSTTPREIINIIRQLPSQKAPGIDKIQNIILKNVGKKVIVQITYIINACIKLAHFPKQWKTGRIIPILKPGKKKSEPSSYRPISLLPTMAKLTEKIILQRLNKYEKNNKIIIDNQFGFREKHNTVQQIARIANDTITNFNKNNVTVLLLLDIEKAFDRVWTDGVLHKMIKYKYPSTIVKLINSYLRNRKLTVAVNDINSTKRKIRAGVPQGSVLGPKLFNIYLNDIPLFQKTQTALFADDTAIYSHSFSAIVAAKQIQIHLNILEKYYTKWKVSLNVAKTEVIVLARKCQNLRIIQPIKVYEQKIEPTTLVKYLGVYMDAKLQYKEHIKQVIHKAYTVLIKLYPLMVNNSPLSQYNKLLVYKMIIRPIIMYAAPIWCSIAKTNLKPLQIFQNKCLRLVLSENKYAKINDLHTKTSLLMIEDYAKELGEKFYNDTQISTNPLTKNITHIRSQNAPFHIKHKLTYQKLNIFRQPN